MQHTLSTHAIDPTTHQEPYRTFTTLLVKLSTHHTFSQTTYLLIFHHLTYPSIYLPIYLPIYLLTLYLLTPHPLALPIYPGTSAFVAQLTVAAATSTRAMELFKEGTSTLSMHILSMHSLTHPINISPTHSINPRSPHPINTPPPPPNTPVDSRITCVARQQRSRRPCRQNEPGRDHRGNFSPRAVHEARHRRRTRASPRPCPPCQQQQQQQQSTDTNIIAPRSGGECSWWLHAICSQ